jgi:hypothetical protein
MAKDLKHLEIRRHRLRRIRATQNLSGRSPGPIHWPTAPLDTNNTSEYQTSIAMEPGARCSIDASSSGSVARFINHSCMPNAQLRDLRCGMDRRLIAVLAPRTIEVGVELTINLAMSGSMLGVSAYAGQRSVRVERLRLRRRPSLRKICPGMSTTPMRRQPRFCPRVRSATRPRSCVAFPLHRVVRLPRSKTTTAAKCRRPIPEVRCAQSTTRKT